MYSVVLMMALTSGGEMPALGHGCCGGGYGCSGCYGCCGGGHHRGHGCCGGGHGCRGGHHKHGCCGGCYGCCGGCYGGCWGGGYGGCYGGCYGGAGMGMGGMGTMGAPIIPGNVVPGNVVPNTPAPSTGGKKTMLDSAPATLVVSVPAGARLSIGGEATTSTATQRVFVSPALNFGRDYQYTVQAEFQKDGKTVKLSKEVAVKAGEETRISFADESAAEVASR